jgi:aryl-alcohol dehydrogenase-like predicted oxidoreductase
VDSVQPPLSLLVRGVRATVLPWAAEHGTGVLCYSPLASGLLTGALDRAALARLDADDWRREAPAFREPLVGRALALVDVLREIASELGSTVPALAIGWVLAQTGVTAAIVGSRRAAHVADWVAAGDIALDADVLRRIDAAITATGAGSDEPPTPPPHIRPLETDAQPSKEPA